MEADVMALGKEIDRLKTQAAIDLELSKPTSSAIVNQPAKQDAIKHGRFSDAYAPAFGTACAASPVRKFGTP